MQISTLSPSLASENYGSRNYSTDENNPATSEGEFISFLRGKDSTKDNENKKVLDTFCKRYESQGLENLESFLKRLLGVSNIEHNALIVDISVRLSRTLAKEKKYSESKEIASKALEIVDKKFGDYSPAAESVKLCLWVAESNLEEWDAGEKTCSELLDLCYWSRSPEKALTTNYLLMEINKKRKDHWKALSAARRFVSNFRETEFSKETLNRAFLAGDILRSEGDYNTLELLGWRYHSIANDQSADLTTAQRRDLLGRAILCGNSNSLPQLLENGLTESESKFLIRQSEVNLENDEIDAVLRHIARTEENKNYFVLAKFKSTKHETTDVVSDLAEIVSSSLNKRAKGLLLMRLVNKFRYQQDALRSVLQGLNKSEYYGCANLAKMYLAGSYTENLSSSKAAELYESILQSTTEETRKSVEALREQLKKVDVSKLPTISKFDVNKLQNICNPNQSEQRFIACLYVLADSLTFSDRGLVSDLMSYVSTHSDKDSIEQKTAIALLLISHKEFQKIGYKQLDDLSDSVDLKQNELDGLNFKFLISLFESTFKEADHLSICATYNAMWEKLPRSQTQFKKLLATQFAYHFSNLEVVSTEFNRDLVTASYDEIKALCLRPGKKRLIFDLVEEGNLNGLFQIFIDQLVQSKGMICAHQTLSSLSKLTSSDTLLKIQTQELIARNLLQISEKGEFTLEDQIKDACNYSALVTDDSKYGEYYPETEKILKTLLKRINHNENPKAYSTVVIALVQLYQADWPAGYGEHNEAAELLIDSLPPAAKSLELAMCLRNLAFTYARNGQLSKVEPCIVRLKKFRESLLQPNDPDILATLLDCAQIKVEERDTSGAIELYREYISKAVAFKENSRTKPMEGLFYLIARSRIDLARLLSSEHRYEDCVREIEVALDNLNDKNSGLYGGQVMSLRDYAVGVYSEALVCSNQYSTFAKLAGDIKYHSNIKEGKYLKFLWGNEQRRGASSMVDSGLLADQQIQSCFLKYSILARDAMLSLSKSQTVSELKQISDDVYKIQKNGDLTLILSKVREKVHTLRNNRANEAELSYAIWLLADLESANNRIQSVEHYQEVAEMLANKSEQNSRLTACLAAFHKNDFSQNDLDYLASQLEKSSFEAVERTVNRLFLVTAVRTVAPELPWEILIDNGLSDFNGTQHLSSSELDILSTAWLANTQLISYSRGKSRLLERGKQFDISPFIAKADELLLESQRRFGNSSHVISLTIELANVQLWWNLNAQAKARLERQLDLLKCAESKEFYLTFAKLIETCIAAGELERADALMQIYGMQKDFTSLHNDCRYPVEFLVTLSKYHGAHHEYTKAYSIAKAAIDIATDSNDVRLKIIACLEISDASAKLGDTKAAVSFAEEALWTSGVSVNPDGSIFGLGTYGFSTAQYCLQSACIESLQVALFESRQFDECLKLVTAVKDWHQADKSPSGQQRYCKDLYLEGSSQNAIGQQDAASKSLLESCESIQNLFDESFTSMSFNEQLGLVTSSDAYFKKLLNVCQKNDFERAYSFILRWKGIVMEMTRQRHLAISTENSTRDSLKRLREVQNQITSTIGKSQGDLSLKNLKALKDEQETIERALLQKSFLKSNDSIRKLDVPGFSSLLKDDECFIDLVKFKVEDEDEDWYGAIVLAKDRKPVLQKLAKESKLDSDFSSTLKGLMNDSNREVRRSKRDAAPGTEGSDATSDWNFSLQKLKSEFWEPIAKEIPDAVSKIYISPEGEISRFPFELLFSKDKTFEISYLNSPRDLVFQKTKTPQACTNQKALLLGGIKFHSLPQLPGTAKEVHKIASLANRSGASTKVFEGKIASKKNLLENATEYSFLHIATHGYFIDDVETSPQKNLFSPARAIANENLNASAVSLSPLLRSGVVLSDVSGSRNDSILTAEEIATLNLQNCRLVCLSACNTGRGLQKLGQGVLGLRGALSSAGARSVLMSLWKVDDDATCTLMTKFYESLWLHNKTVSESLRDAKSYVREQKKWSHPFFWAGWVLSGDVW